MRDTWSSMNRLQLSGLNTSIKSLSLYLRVPSHPGGRSVTIQFDRESRGRTVVGDSSRGLRHPLLPLPLLLLGFVLRVLPSGDPRVPNSDKSMSLKGKSLVESLPPPLFHKGVVLG